MSKLMLRSEGCDRPHLDNDDNNAVLVGVFPAVQARRGGGSGDKGAAVNPDHDGNVADLAPVDGSRLINNEMEAVFGHVERGDEGIRLWTRRRHFGAVKPEAWG